MRASAFVSGGLIPLSQRGTKSNIRFHIVDWYSTFCYLAGVDHNDDPPVPPLPVNPLEPKKDIYGKRSWPSVDGVVIWDMLIKPENYNETSAHPTLVLSAEVILKGNLKLMTAQRGDTHQNFDSFENLWQDQEGTWFSPPGWNQVNGQHFRSVDVLSTDFTNLCAPSLRPAGFLCMESQTRRSNPACSIFRWI